MATVMLVAACSNEDVTPTASSGTAGETPTLEAFVPTPSPAPTVVVPSPIPTPTSFSVSVPLPPTSTPRPTATPDPEASAKYIEELLTLIEDELPTTRLYPQSFVLDDGRILFAGGVLPTVGNQGLYFGGPHPFIEVYNPVTDSWSLEDPIMPLLAFVKAVKLADGSILILGIEETQTETEALPFAAYVLDGKTLAPTRVSPPTASRASPDLILMDDGRVAAIGGIDALSESSIFDVPVSLAVEIYDPSLDMWVEASAQPGGLTREFNFWGQDEISQWVFPLGGSRVLTVRVGESVSDDDSIRDEVVLIDSFDATTNMWESLARLHTSFSDQPWHATASTDGTVSIVYPNRIESFDPSNGEWSISYAPDSVILVDPEREESFTFERQALPLNASITELPDGRFLVAGGERGGYSSLPRSTTVVYDPATKLWVLGPELVEPRVGHSAAVLDNGSVLLFGGATVWEENENEGIPTNSMEIISAAEIAAVDTVTLPTTNTGKPIPPISYPCWGLTSSPEPLPVVNDDRRDLPDAARLVTDSLDALNRIDSFSLTFLAISLEGEAGERVMQASRTDCEQSSHTYETPGSLTSESASFHRRSYHGTQTQVLAEHAWYIYSQERDTWLVQRFVEDEESQVIDLIIRKSMLSDSTIMWEIIAIEDMNGENVWHVRGSKSENTGETQATSSLDLWIGVDDNLIRRMFIHEDSPGYSDPSRRTQDYILTEIERFGEEFNIQPPLTVEEAAQPEASGGLQCRRAYRPEVLTQSKPDGETAIQSAKRIMIQSAQAMSALASYETLDVTYELSRRVDPDSGELSNSFFVLNCDWQRNQFVDVGQLNSHSATIEHSDVVASTFRIIVGQTEYTRESRDSDWTSQAYDSSRPFLWPHPQFLELNFDDPQFDLEVVGIESLKGEDVYHISIPVDTEDEDRNAFSIWIGVEDFLLRRVFIVSSEEIIEEDSLHTTKRLIEFHSFNEDFNIQPPPESEIAE